MKLTSLCAHKQTAAVNCTLVLWAGLNDIEARPFTHLKHLPSLPGDRSPSQPRTDATSGFSTREADRRAADVKWVFRVRSGLGRASPPNIAYRGPEIFIIPVPHRQVIIADNGYPARASLLPLRAIRARCLGNAGYTGQFSGADYFASNSATSSRLDLRVRRKTGIGFPMDSVSNVLECLPIVRLTPCPRHNCTRISGRGYRNSENIEQYGTMFIKIVARNHKEPGNTGVPWKTDFPSRRPQKFPNRSHLKKLSKDRVPSDPHQRAPKKREHSARVHHHPAEARGEKIRFNVA